MPVHTRVTETPEAISPAGAEQEEPTMADQETKADDKEDEDDTQGHNKPFGATPDEDRAANRNVVHNSDDAKDGNEDTEGHRF
jgi:hypothetical protein